MNRTRHIISAAAAAAAILVSSCARDLGNYSYTGINGPEISGIGEKYDVLTQEMLEISVTMSGGLPEDSYDYEWKVIDRNNDNTETVIGTSRDLSYRVVLSPGAYSLYYTVTEKDTGLFWRTVSDLTVSTSMAEGWMVLCSEGGRARLDFISEITGETYRDVLSGNGMPEYMGPRKIQWLSSMTDEASPYYLLTDDGATRLGKDSFEWKEEYLMKYESGSFNDLRPYSITSSGFGKVIVSGSDAYYCETMGISGLYGNAVNRGFRVAPQVGGNVLATQVYAALYLLYDLDNRKFMAYCPLLERPDLGSQDALQEMDAMGEIAESMSSEGQAVVGTAFGSYPVGLDYIYMENTRYDPGNAYMGVTYTILSDGSNYYVYGIQCGDMLTYADCTYVIGKASYADISGCTGIADASLFAFSSLKNYMYYAVGGKVYRADMSSVPVTTELQFELEGETVTCLKFNLYQNTENRLRTFDLIVGSETESGEGILRIYEGYDSDGIFKGAEPAGQYGGFARITDATYKETIY